MLRGNKPEQLLRSTASLAVPGNSSVGKLTATQSRTRYVCDERDRSAGAGVDHGHIWKIPPRMILVGWLQLDTGQESTST